MEGRVTPNSFDTTNHRGEALMHEAICAYEGVLNPREISALRKRLGFSLKELAQRTGIAAELLQKWENGLRLPSKEGSERLQQIASQFC
jgi:DNA-binding transcriptional regulator YiaG